VAQQSRPRPRAARALGEIRVPVLQIVDWVKGEGVTASLAQHGDDMDDEIPF
jgi:hypothetical protein